MLGVENHPAAVVFEETHRLVNQFFVGLILQPQPDPGMGPPGLAENGDYFGLRLKQGIEIWVGGHFTGAAGSGAETTDLRLPQFQVPGLAEKLLVPGIAARPTAFDNVDTEFVQ